MSDNEAAVMAAEIEEMLTQYRKERDLLVAEANERIQKQQVAAAEHNARMGEIQMRLAQAEGAMEALQGLTEGRVGDGDGDGSGEG